MTNEVFSLISLTMLGHAKKTTDTTFTIFYNQFSDIVSPRSVVSCCLPCRRLVTRVACVCPREALFIVVNVVFVVFHPQQAHRERARWQGSFRSCGEVPLVGAVGGWPVGSPGARPPPLRRAGGRVSDLCRRGCKSRGYKQTFCCSLGREACRPAPWVNRPACRRPGLRRYPGLRRLWWPS